MSLMWFSLGALMVLIFWGVKAWTCRRQVDLSWVSWSGIVLNVILILFTLAWFFTSMAENEIQAARAGLIVFGGVSLVFLGLTRQSVVRDQKSSRLK